MSYVLAIRKQDSIHPLSHEKVVYPLLENAAPDFCHCGIPSENSKIPVFGLKILMRIKHRGRGSDLLLIHHDCQLLITDNLCEYRFSENISICITKIIIGLNIQVHFIKKGTM